MSNIAQFRPPQVVQQDDEVADALRAGAPDALRALVDRHGACVVAAATHVTDRVDLAQAATGRTFAAARSRAGELEPGADFAPWLADLLVESLEPTDAGSSRADDPAPLIDRAWMVRAAIDALGESDRDLLRLHHVDGLGVDEVGERTAIGPEVARSRVVLVHRRLASQLAHLSDDGPGSVDASAAELTPEVAELLGDPRIWVPFDESVATSLVAVAGGPVDRTPEAVGTDGEPEQVDSMPAPGARPFISRSVLFGLIGAGLTILLLGAGIVVFSAAGEPPAVATFEVEMVPTGLVPDVEGTIEVTELDTGLRIELDAPSLPRRAAGSFYEGWLRLADDRLVPVGTFQQGTEVTLSAGIELDRVLEMVVTLGAAAEDGEPVDADSQVVLKVDFPTE